MKYIRAAFLLTVSILFFGFCQSAFCAGEEKSISHRVSALEYLVGSEWMVLSGENDPQPVGEIVHLSDRSAHVIMDINGHKFMTIVDKYSGFYGSYGMVLFNSQDCSGQAYKSSPAIQNWRDFHWFKDVYLGPALGGVEPVVPYEIVDQQVWITFESSIAIAEGGESMCVVREPSLELWAYPINPLSEDLNNIFPPPYHLVEK